MAEYRITCEELQAFGAVVGAMREALVAIASNVESDPETAAREMAVVASNTLVATREDLGKVFGKLFSNLLGFPVVVGKGE